MTTKITAPKTTITDTTTFEPKVKDKKYSVAMPTGFDWDKNKPMKKRQFTSDAIYYEHRAEQMTYKADAFRAKAKEIAALGSRADQAKAKKMLKLSNKIAELKAELAGQGIDVEELMKAAAKAETK